MSAAWIALMTMPTMPRTTTAAGAACGPPRTRTLVSRAPNWPPAEAFSTQSDHASPAFSSSDGSSTPTAEVAATVTSPEPTSTSGLAFRVRAIRPPAMIMPTAATAAENGNIHCWSWATAGSPARPGDGTRTRQSTLLETTNATPDSTAAAIPDSASPAA